LISRPGELNIGRAEPVNIRGKLLRELGPLVEQFADRLHRRFELLRAFALGFFCLGLGALVFCALEHASREPGAGRGRSQGRREPIALLGVGMQRPGRLLFGLRELGH